MMLFMMHYHCIIIILLLYLKVVYSMYSMYSIKYDYKLKRFCKTFSGQIMDGSGLFSNYTLYILYTVFKALTR